MIALALFFSIFMLIDALKILEKFKMLMAHQTVRQELAK